MPTSRLCHRACRPQGAHEWAPGQRPLRSQSAAAERQISHEKCPENMLDLFLFCLNLSSLAILLSAQPKVGQMEPFEYKQALEQLPLLGVLVGDVSLRGGGLAGWLCCWRRILGGARVPGPWRGAAVGHHPGIP